MVNGRRRPIPRWPVPSAAPWDARPAICPGIPLCLPQALAARVMLRRRGIPSSLYFGIRLDGDDRAMRAHAWVTAGATGVVGVPATDEFTVLARYSR